MVLGSTKVEHQVKNGFLHLVRAAVGLVDLVDDHDRLQTEFDSLLQHETSLRHWTFEGIDQKQHAVGHVQDTLHLTAKVGVARGVDDVDLHVLVAHRHILRKDSDAAFAFEVVIVENELAGCLVRFLEQLGLVQDAVHEGGLAMVNVSDNSYISDILHFSRNFL